MAMLIGAIVVLIGVVYGWYTDQGSGIHRRPHGRDGGVDHMNDVRDWSRGGR